MFQGRVPPKSDNTKYYETIFQNFFGGGNGSKGRRQRRGEDIVHPLKVSLEDLYSGTSKKLSLSCNVLCSKCKSNKGSKSGASIEYSGCQGSGSKVSSRQIRPSRIQQMQYHIYAISAMELDRTSKTKTDAISVKGQKVA
ncbi:hypothetical protein IFM89_039469 [Coptis chinensis]|uniref:Uncharacterized protein n=1 Tax=Coptis chinensis TaxID=261450 RepID=A0A835HTL7_9MAGN|nr:hypothetical protein IFM89_039469 [Coptis chinensis]